MHPRPPAHIGEEEGEGPVGIARKIRHGRLPRAADIAAMPHQLAPAAAICNRLSAGQLPRHRTSFPLPRLDAERVAAEAQRRRPGEGSTSDCGCQTLSTIEGKKRAVEGQKEAALALHFGHGSPSSTRAAVFRVDHRRLAGVSLSEPFRPVLDVQSLPLRRPRSSSSAPCWRCSCRRSTRPSSPPPCRRSPRDLGGFALISWVVTAYLLTSTCVTPIVGKLSDLYGRRRILNICLILFMIGSALCALAPSMPLLILFRGAAGAGRRRAASTVAPDDHRRCRLAARARALCRVFRRGLGQRLGPAARRPAGC